MTELDVTRERLARSRAPVHKIQHKKPRQRFRGMPPPPTFDFDAMADCVRLTDTETAAILRRSRSTLELWRKWPDHPLRWTRVGGRILYELGSIRAFLKGTE